MPDTIVFATPRRSEAEERLSEYRREGYKARLEQNPLTDNWLILREVA